MRRADAMSPFRGRLLQRLSAVLLLTTAMPVQVLAGPILPTGGTVVSGSATIQSSANALTVNQTSKVGIINWQSFSIGAGNSVAVNNGAGATLSRVTGNISSEIAGSLTATGSLTLVNPAGIVVTSSGKVATGGSFIASTHNVSDQQFASQGAMTFSGSSDASVVNNGTITSAGGDVALIARKVENAGSISAPNGTAALVAGYDVLLSPTDGTDGKFSVKVGGSDTGVVNSGSVKAAEIEMRANGGNVYALAGNTKSVVKATGVTNTGGRIFLTAGDTGSVTVAKSARIVARKPAATKLASTGRARNQDGGSITLRGGSINVAGTLDASAKGTGTTGGTVSAIAVNDLSATGTLLARGGIDATGGFIETSGAKVNFAGITVDTTSKGGTSGLWLIDPTDLIIDAAAASAIDGALATTDVTLTTTSSGAPTATGVTGATNTTQSGNGDIDVNAALSWSSSHTLTLNAYNNININAAITAPTGGLTLTAGSAISATAGITVGAYLQTAGAFAQNTSTLPTFSASNFTVSGGSFLRVTGGDGSSGNPYQIADVYGLQGIGSSTALLADSYELVNNIDASGTANWNSGAGFVPIGVATTWFSGALFNGQGYTISGLTINSQLSTVGLFGQINDGNTSANGIIENINLTGSALSGPVFVGGVVGYIYNTGILSLSNVSSSGTFSSTGSTNQASVGGVLGGSYHVGLRLSNLSASGTVSGVNVAGGVIGSFGGGVLGVGGSLSFSGTVTATGTASTAGGIFGRSLASLQVFESDLNDWHATGSVSADTAGGLIGSWGANVSSSASAGAPVELTNSSFAGTVTGTTAAGGLVGTIPVSVYLPVVVGLFGDSSSGSVNAPTAGGLVGALTSFGFIHNSQSAATVTGSIATGGLAGNVGSATLSTQSVYGGTIQSSYFNGTVNGGAGAAGGIAGTSAGVIADTYALGSVTGATAGGLVGSNASTGTVSTSWAANAVSGTAIGGVTGTNDGTVNSSVYWDTTTGPAAGYVTNTGTFSAVGLTTAQFSSSSNLPGLTFTTTPGGTGWVIVDSDGTLNNTNGAAGGTRPILATEYSTTITNAHQLQLMVMDPTASYVLGNSIDATATAGTTDIWGASGFVPIGGYGAANFVGSLNGQGYIVNGLTINLPSATDVGLFGFASGGSISNLGLTNVTVTGQNYVGALVGRDYSSILNSYATGTVTGASEVGGLVGITGPGASISLSHADVAVTGTGGDVGGLVGSIADGAISQSYANGTVVSTTSGTNFWGGFAGDMEGGSITQSFATGNVSGPFAVGGFVGALSGGTITDAYATGSVNASVYYAGGFLSSQTGGTIAQVYATGYVTSGGGSPFGLAHGSASLTNGYWDTMTSGTSSTASTGTPQTTTQLQAALPSGFDSSVWGIVAGKSYPYFLWQYPAGKAPVAISGTAFSDLGATPLAGASVSVLSGGTTLGTVTTGANGYFYLLEPASAVSGSTGVLSTLSSGGTGAAFADAVSGSLANQYIFGHYLDINTSDTTYSTVRANLTTTIGSNAAVQTAVSGLGNLQLNIGGSGFVVDQAISTGTLIINSNGPVTQTAPITATGLELPSGGTYTLTGANAIGTLAVNGGSVSLTDTIPLTIGTVGGATGILATSLTLNDTGTISDPSAGVNVGSFTLAGGDWVQNQTSLPAFSAANFTVSGGSFLRVTGGDGSSGTPYQIADVYGLQGIGTSATLLADNYVLANDIDASGTSGWNATAGFVPIGNATTKFTGSFNGANHAINRLTIDIKTQAPDVGLFGFVGAAGTLSNVSVTNASVTGDSYIGILAGENDGTIGNSTTSGTLTFDYISGGGLVGNSTLTGAITNSSTSATVNGFVSVGGLVGRSEGMISNSSASGEVTGFYVVGGLAGHSSGSITSSYSTGAVTITAGGLGGGGLVGENDGTVKTSYATGDVTGLADVQYVGGLIGRSSSAVVEQSFATGTVTTTGSSVGGLIGAANSSTIKNSYATGAVTGTTRTGGLVGASSSSQISNSYASGAVSGTTGTTGGLVGLQDGNGSVTGSFFNTTTTGKTVGIGTDTSTSASSFAGLTTAEMMQDTPFTSAGWSIATNGGSGDIWRIYNGNTAPLLLAFMTPTTVTATDVSKTYDGTAYSGTYSATYSNPSATLSGTLGSNLASTVNAGTYAIGGLYSGQFGYDISMSGTLTINPATLTYTANAASMTYGSQVPSLTGTVTGFVNGETLATATMGTAGFTTTATAASNVGSYAITGSGLTADNGNYVFAQAAGNATALTINRALLTLTATPPAASKTYGQTLALTGYTETGLQAGDTLSSVTLTSAGTAATANVGLYDITASNALFATGSASNYTITYQTLFGGLNVSPAALGITANAASKTYGSALTFSGTSGYTVQGLVNGDAVTSVTLASAGAAATAGVGGYSITPSAAQGSGLSNYAISYNQGQLSVGAAPLTITANNQSKTYGSSLALGSTAYTITSGQLYNTDTITGVTLFSPGASATAPSGSFTLYATGSTGSGLGNYAITYGNGTLKVDQAALTIAANNQSKTYGSSLTLGYSTAYTITAGRLYNSDAITSVYLSSGGAGSTATVAGGPYAITAQGAQGTGLYNYAITYTNGALTVNPAALIVTASNASKTYDGLAYSGGNGVSYAGFVNGQTASVLGGTLTYGGTAQGAVNAGSYGITASGLSASNYAITYASGTLTVNPAALTVTANAASKTYGATDPSLSYSYSSLVNGDTAASVFTGSLARASGENVASYAITQGTLSAGGNYTISYTGAAFTINPAALTVTANAATKGYDGTAYAGGNGVSYTGFVNNETASVLSGTLAYGGTAQGAVNAGQYTITASGLTSSNYAISYLPGTLTISQAALTLSITPDAASKTYGQTLTLTGYAATGLQGNDTLSSVTLSSAGTAASANVGHYDITASNAQFATGSAANYAINYQTLAGGLTVNPAALTVTANAASKTYGASDPSLSYSYSSLVNGDTAASVFTGALSRASGQNAGAYAITQGTLSAGGNYTIAYTGAAFTINPAALTVTANAASKGYDGTAYAGGNGVSYAGFVNNETASVLSGTLSYGGTAQGAVNAGQYTITASGLSSTNYAISYLPGTLTISQAALTLSITPDAASKTYGQTLTLTGYAATGLQGNDTLSSVTLSSTGTAASANVGHYDITASNAQFATGSATNYAINYQTLAGGLTVNPAALTVTANTASKTYGASDPSLSYSYSSLVNGDTAASVFTGALSRASGQNAGAYAITQGTLSAGGNYTISYTGAAFTINPAALTVTANAATKGYDGTAYAGGNGVSYAGFVNNETASVLSGTLTYGGTAQGAVNAGQYTITASGLTSSNYAISYLPGTLTISQAALTLSITPDAASKTYGQTLTLTGYAATGLQGNDTLSSVTLSSTGTAASANVGHYDITASNAQFATGSAANYAINYQTLAGGLTVNPAALTVTANTASKTYGAADPSLSYSYSSLVNGDTAASVFTGSLARASGENVASYAITQGTLSAGGNYTIAYTGAAFTINPAALTVTANAASKTYGTTDPSLSYSYSSLVNGDTAASVFTGSLARASGENVAPYAITQGTLSAGGNYTIAYTGAAFTINPAALTITADNQSLVSGSALPPLTVSYTGFVAGDSARSLSQDATVTSATPASAPAGTYAGTITAAGAIDPNYSISYVAGTLTISAPASTGTVASAALTSSGQPNLYADAQGRVTPGTATTLTYTVSTSTRSPTPTNAPVVDTTGEIPTFSISPGGQTPSGPTPGPTSATSVTTLTFAPGTFEILSADSSGSTLTITAGAGNGASNNPAASGASTTCSASLAAATLTSVPYPCSTTGIVR